MNDTHPDITAEIDKRMKMLSGKDRFTMGVQMFETARQMAIASLKTDAKSAAELRVKLFLRFYSDDFDEKTRSAIVNHLSKEYDDAHPYFGQR